MTNTELFDKYAFSLSPEMSGQRFDVKFLPNKTPHGKHIYELVIGMGFMGRKMRRYLSYALINGELKAFIYTPMVYKMIPSVIMNMFNPLENVGFRIIGGCKEIETDKEIVMVSNPDIKVVNDDKFILTEDTFPFEEMKKFDLDDIYAVMKEKCTIKPRIKNF